MGAGGAGLEGARALVESGRPEAGLRALATVLLRRELAADAAAAVMDLAREAAGSCSTPRLRMLALVLGGDIQALEQDARDTPESAILCAMAGLGDRPALADTLQRSGHFGQAALVLDDFGSHVEAAAAWRRFSEAAGRAGHDALRALGDLRAALALARTRGDTGCDPEVDAAARALESIGDRLLNDGVEHRAYDCYAAAATGLDRSYVRLPVIHEKLRRLVAGCMLPALACQFDAQLIELALESGHRGRARLLAQRGLAYAELWQPAFCEYFSAAVSGDVEVRPPSACENLNRFVDRAVRADVMELETRSAPVVSLARVVLDRHFAERDRRLACGVCILLHLHDEPAWRDDELVRLIEALGRMQASVAEAVIEPYLSHPSARVRRAVAEAASVDSRRALEWLQTLGADPAREVREAAAASLARHRAPSSLAGLIHIWQRSPGGAMADAAVTALAALRRHGSSAYGVPTGQLFDRLLESGVADVGKLLAQVR